MIPRRRLGLCWLKKKVFNDEFEFRSGNMLKFLLPFNQSLQN